MLLLELLVLLIQTTCPDQQDKEAAFETSKAFITHYATSSKVNIHYFIILVVLFYNQHKFCNIPECIDDLPATDNHSTTLLSQ